MDGCGGVRSFAENDVEVPDSGPATTTSRTQLYVIERPVLLRLAREREGFSHSRLYQALLGPVRSPPLQPQQQSDTDEELPVLHKSVSEQMLFRHLDPELERTNTMFHHVPDVVSVLLL